MEFVVRRQLTQLGQSLSGLYSGNPKRQTARPTAEQLSPIFTVSYETLIFGFLLAFNYEIEAP